MVMISDTAHQHEPKTFSGNIFIFYAFDVGDDINLTALEAKEIIISKPLVLSNYFKNYHIPLAVELPYPHESRHCLSSKLHNFGVISLTYKIPFHDTLENLKKELYALDIEYREQSIADAQVLFDRIKPFVKQSRFFHLRTSYVIIQVDQQPQVSVDQLKEYYSGTIASLVRFETESLSEFQKDAILDSATGYYRGDLIIIDTEAAFVYDEDYQAVLDLFEFANIQQVELQYYDRSLDQHLNVVYVREVWTLPITAYIPFISMWMKDPMGDLDRLKVEISAIIERIESGIKLAGDVYASETYTLLVEKLDLRNWKESIDNKLAIIRDIHHVYQNKIDTIREDLLSVLVIVLIFIELVVGILAYLK